MTYLFGSGLFAASYWHGSSDESRMAREAFFHLSAERTGAAPERRPLDYIMFSAGLTSANGYEADANHSILLEDATRVDEGSEPLRESLRHQFLEAIALPGITFTQLTQRLTEDPDLTLDAADASRIIEGVAIMASPLLPRTGADQAFSDWIASATQVMIDRVPEWKVFNDEDSSFVTLLPEQIDRASMNTAVFVLEHYRPRVWGLVPDTVRLTPEEQERANTDRIAVKKRAMQAIEAAFGPWFDSYHARIRGRQAADNAAAAQAAAERDTLARSRPAPRPEPQPFGVSPRGAEFWVRDAARWLGATEAETTQASGDGGIDVITDDYVISVKHYAKTVPVEEVREILAVATTAGKRPVLFTSGTLTEAGASFAALAQVAVVQYFVETATFTGLNEAGDEILRDGLNTSTDVVAGVTGFAV
jgi:hypothetical protein